MANLGDSIRNLILEPLAFIYLAYQWLLDKLFSPTPPKPGAHLHRPRIAVIGAGLTGVSAASHCIVDGFDSSVFEAGDKDSVGGIWTVISSKYTILSLTDVIQESK